MQNCVFLDMITDIGTSQGPEEGSDPVENRIQIVGGSNEVDFRYWIPPRCSEVLANAECFRFKDLSDILPSYPELQNENFPLFHLPGEKLAPVGVMPETPEPPVMLAQANFISGGLLLTVAFHHSASDAIGIDEILKSWACNTRAIDGPESRTLYDATSNDCSPLCSGLPGTDVVDFPEYVFYPTPQAEKGITDPLAEKATAPAFTMPPMTAKICYFSPEKLATLKVTASSYSTYDAVCALIWNSITLARYPGTIKEEEDEMMTALLCSINIRPRASPPLPSTYLGNASMAVKTFPVSIASVKSASTLNRAANRVRDALNQFSNPDRVPLTIGLLDSRRDPTDYKLACNYYMGPDVMMTSWADIGVYQCEWGTLGAPQAFRTPGDTAADGVVTIFPRVLDGGLEISIGLEVEAMKRMLMDEQFLNFAQIQG